MSLYSRNAIFLSRQRCSWFPLYDRRRNILGRYTVFARTLPSVSLQLPRPMATDVSAVPCPLLYSGESSGSAL
jgi:hypothetical protein